VVRIFNTYGPRMRPDDGRAIPTFIHQALAGAPLRDVPEMSAWSPTWPTGRSIWRTCWLPPNIEVSQK